MKTVVKLLAAIILLAVCFYIFKFKSKTDVGCTDCNVILVSIDTLRSDHLGCYGYTLPTSAEIDSFCKDSVQFKTAIAQAPSTAPSHASIFTSLIPSSHGTFVSRNSQISLNAPTIAEILKAKGFKTASFNGGGQLDKRYGFNRGFDIYQSYAEANYENEKLSDRVKESIEWIDKNKGSKFFLFLHSYDIHSPYAPEQKDMEALNNDYKGQLTLPIAVKTLRSINSGRTKINDEDLAFIKRAYDAEIRSADRAFGNLIKYLKENNLYDNSIIILTSDHGEEFGEHGSVGWHSHTLYDELLLVPLVIKFPNQAFADTSHDFQVRGIDIFPTVLDTIKADKIAGFQGQSVLPFVNGEDPEKFDPHAISQKDMKKGPPTSLRTKEWKLYKQALFNLIEDPKEKKNVAPQNTKIRDQFRAIVEKFKNAKDDSEAPAEAETSPESIEQLKTLGYL